MAQILNITSKGQGMPLVLIHGWGLNSAVWQPCIEILALSYEVITVDLPGFATNSRIISQPYSLEEIARMIQQAVGKPAVYIGWSLGGLIATQINLIYSQQVMALVTIASSPAFLATQNWPGIKPEVLSLFHHQLCSNTEKTINNFLKMQALGSTSVRKDIKLIRTLIMQFDLPKKDILEHSLTLLETANLSKELIHIKQPFLRIYGRLDSLVPQRVIPLIDELAPNSQRYILQQAAHAPFISHQNEFLSVLKRWLNDHIKYNNFCVAYMDVST